MPINVWLIHLDVTLADPGGVTTIQLLHSSQVLATLTRAAIPPLAIFTAPAAGTLSGFTTVSWNLIPGTIPAAGLLQDLHFSTDDGITWIPAAFNIPGTLISISLVTNLLPITSHGRLRLVISDGLNNITAASPNTYNVGNHPPFVNIVNPPPMAVISSGAEVSLDGLASDVDEEQIPDSRFQWTMDGGIILGVGHRIWTILPDGRHIITLTVLDSLGASGTASVSVYSGVNPLFLLIIMR